MIQLLACLWLVNISNISRHWFIYFEMCLCWIKMPLLKIWYILEPDNTKHCELLFFEIWFISSIGIQDKECTFFFFWLLYHYIYYQLVILGHVVKCQRVEKMPELRQQIPQNYNGKYSVCIFFELFWPLYWKFESCLSMQ